MLNCSAAAVPLTAIRLPSDSSSGAFYSLWEQLCCGIALFNTTFDPRFEQKKTERQGVESRLCKNNEISTYL